MAPPADLDRLLAQVPPPSDRNLTLRVDRSGERQLRKRHPWLFEAGVRSQSHEGRAGDRAVIFDHQRKFLAIGLYDPHSPLRVRILHAGKPARLDAAFFAARLRDCAERRRDFDPAITDGVREVHGENEGMPGFVLDRYADTLVLKLYTPAWLPHLRDVLPALVARPGVRRLVLRLARETARREDELFGLHDGQVLHGPELEGPVLFREAGLRYECDPVAGQKTGFFLDQRDNRARVGSICADREVLNVFSYTGGFSLAAARGGARSVLSLDLSQPALDAAERNFALNRGDPAIARCVHHTMAADAFEGLRQLDEQGARFDLVVLDPPSFAHRQDDVERALGQYRRLTRAGLRVLRPGGLLVAASCSARVPASDFCRTVVDAAVASGRRLAEVERHEHPVDHPIGFPQGAYLKCLYATAR